jgi:hypothetical protein
LQREHAHYFAALAEKAEPHLTGTHQVEWMVRLEDEHDNMRAVLQWAKEKGQTGNREAGEGVEAEEAAQTGLRLAAALWRFWQVRGYLSEGREQLNSVLTFGPRRAKGEAAREARAKVLNGVVTRPQSSATPH